MGLGAVLPRPYMKVLLSSHGGVSQPPFAISAFAKGNLWGKVNDRRSAGIHSELPEPIR